jgi:hypothetical protein
MRLGDLGTVEAQQDNLRLPSDKHKGEPDKPKAPKQYGNGNVKSSEGIYTSHAPRQG